MSGASRRTGLYRFFDCVGDLLYAGITYSPKDRLATHVRDAFWFEDVRTITIQWYATRDAGRDAEREAIINEVPGWNHFDSWASIPLGLHGVACQIGDEAPRLTADFPHGGGAEYRRIQELVELAERGERVAELRRSGVSTVDIAGRLGVSVATVYNDLRRGLVA